VTAAAARAAAAAPPLARAPRRLWGSSLPPGCARQLRHNLRARRRPDESKAPGGAAQRDQGAARKMGILNSEAKALHFFACYMAFT
jgi:hypothetical protein